MISAISLGKVFEGQMDYYNKKLSFRLVFEKVEGENFESQSSIYTEGFGFLLDISKSSNGKIIMQPENSLSLSWTDEKSDFNAEYDLINETIKGKFNQNVEFNSDIQGSFLLNVLNVNN